MSQLHNLFFNRQRITEPGYFYGYRLKEEMAASHLAILVDMQAKPARGAADFLCSIADDIAYELEEVDILLELPDRAEFEKAPEFTFRNRFLRQTYNLLDGRNLLLMFDEFEELQRRVEAGRLSPDIFSYLRNLMQHEERVDLFLPAPTSWKSWRLNTGLSFSTLRPTKKSPS